MPAAAHRLDRSGAETVLTTAMGTAPFLYQPSRPTPTLQQLYTEEPRWARFALRPSEQLQSVLTAAVRGATANLPS